MDASWYYIPEDTACGRLPGHDRREVFESVHSDENPIESIDGLCRVLSWDEYQQWLTEEADDDDDDDEEEEEEEGQAENRRVGIIALDVP